MTPRSIFEILSELEKFFENIIIEIIFKESLSVEFGEYATNILCQKRKLNSEHQIHLDEIVEEISHHIERRVWSLIKKIRTPLPPFKSDTSRCIQDTYKFKINIPENTIEYHISQINAGELYYLIDKNNNNKIITNSPYHLSGNSKILDSIPNAEIYRPLGTGIIQANIHIQTNSQDTPAHENITISSHDPGGYCFDHSEWNRNNEHKFRELFKFLSNIYLIDTTENVPINLYNSTTQSVRFNFLNKNYEYKINYNNNWHSIFSNKANLRDFFKIPEFNLRTQPSDQINTASCNKDIWVGMFSTGAIAIYDRCCQLSHGQHVLIFLPNKSDYRVFEKSWLKLRINRAKNDIFNQYSAAYLKWLSIPESLDIQKEGIARLVKRAGLTASKKTPFEIHI